MSSPNNPRLFLSRICEDYVPERDYVLGPWCFIGFEDDYPDWEKQVFLDPFQSGAEKKEAVEACANLASFLVGDLAGKLNKRHCRNYPYEYWWTLLIRWLLILVPGLWRRWATISNFSQKLGQEVLTTVIDGRGLNAKWRFSDTERFLYRGILDEGFDYWLLSVFVNELAPSTWFLETANAKTLKYKHRFIPAPENKTNLFKRFVRGKLGHLSFNHVPGAGPLATLTLSGYIKLLNPKTVENEFYARRCFSPPRYFPDKFLGLVNEISNLVLPSSFDENFCQFEEKASNNSYKKGRIYITGGATVLDNNNFETAHALINGERVVRCQHGADYGTMNNTIHEALPEYTGTAFLTWGWDKSDQFTGNFIPTPSPLLSKVQNKFRKTEDRIMLVGSKTWVHTCHIDQVPEPTYALRYRASKVEFVSELNEEVRGQLVYRPYLRGLTDLQDGQHFSKRFPEIPFFEGDLHKYMLGCGLLVIDHPGTTLHVAMAMGVPIIGFWEKNAWPISNNAKPYFDALSEVGVLHSDPKSAASKVNEVFDHSIKWWTTPAVQVAREAWLSQFGQASRSWWIDWLRIIRKI